MLDSIARPLLPVMVGSELHVVGAQVSQQVADFGQVPVMGISSATENHVRAVLDWPLLGQYRTVAAGPDSDGCLIPDDPRTLHMIIGLGQSLSLGATAWDSLIDTVSPWPDDALTFALSASAADVRMGLSSTASNPQALDPDTLVGFAPLVARPLNTRGQTIMESCALSLAALARACGARFRTLSVTCGQGGTAYQGLKKGSVAYGNMVAAVTRAQELCEAEDWKLVVLAALVKHGESDVATTTYQADLAEWQADVTTDVQAITGQASVVPFILQAPSSHHAGSNSISPATSRAVRAMYNAHLSIAHIHVTGPDYPFASWFSPDFVHFRGGGYALIGEMLAEGIKDVCFRAAQKTRIVHVTSGTLTCDTVVLDYHVPVPPLVIDAMSVDQAGFRFRDNDGEIAITNVSVTGPAQITLTLATCSTAGNPRVYVAHSPQLFPRTAERVPRTAIRDSAGDARKARFDGSPLHNWAVAQIVNI